MFVFPRGAELRVLTEHRELSRQVIRSRPAVYCKLLGGNEQSDPPLPVPRRTLGAKRPSSVLTLKGM